MRPDNGPEFVSQAILEWIASAGIANVLNDPGKPGQNGADESFNGKFRDECLSIDGSVRVARQWPLLRHGVINCDSTTGTRSALTIPDLSHSRQTPSQF